VTAVVEVQNVSKHFRLYHERHKTLKERLIHPGSGSYTDLTAVNDVTFKVNAAQTVGILGRNGSGKSTLLKCICGVLQPTAGRIVVRGSLAGLLELGAGFQTELSRRQVDKLFDAIVDFSELDGFIDTQVKFYSSGMYVRLGFAVAVNVDPDVLIVDEVLAVGDERFQTKCMDRIRQFQQEGRTIMLVSHNADQVRSLCDRAIVLDHGVLIADGPSGEAVKIFREALLGEARMDDVAGEAGHEGAVMIDAITTPTGRFDARTGEPWSCDVAVTATEPVEGFFVIEIHDLKGALVSRTDPRAAPVSLRPGAQRIGITFASMPLLDGSYEISVGIVSELGHGIVTWREQLATLEVNYEGRARGIVPLSPTVTVY